MIACRRQPPSLRALCPELPWSLDALAAKCIAFDPARRYARAADLAEDLRRFLDNLPMKHGPEPSVRERMGKWARRHPGLCGSTSIAIVAMLLIGLLGGAVALVYDKMQDLSARVRYRVFDQDFTEIQFLLNTAGGSNEHLKRGIEKAAKTIGPSALSRQAPARWGDWVRRLTPEERRRLREQVVELIMLEARARVLLASQGGSKAGSSPSDRAGDRPARPRRDDRTGGPIRSLRRTSALSRRARQSRAGPARSKTLPADHAVHLPRPDAPGDKPTLRRAIDWEPRRH